MSNSKWLIFLLKLVDIVLDAVREFLTDQNEEEPPKTPAVGG